MCFCARNDDCDHAYILSFKLPLALCCPRTSQATWFRRLTVCVIYLLALALPLPHILCPVSKDYVINF